MSKEDLICSPCFSVPLYSFYPSNLIGLSTLEAEFILKTSNFKRRLFLARESTWEIKYLEAKFILKLISERLNEDIRHERQE